MLNSWFSLFLTDNLTPKLIIMCMWKITDVYFLAQSARKKNSNSDHNRDHRKENPSNHRNLWRKKVKSQTNLCETLTHLLPFKEKKSQKTLDIWEQFLWFTAPLGDSGWKKLYFTTYKLTKMMQMSDYVIKTNKNKPKTTLSLVFPILHAVAEVKAIIVLFKLPDMSRHVYQKSSEKAKIIICPANPRVFLKKTKITTKQFADLIVCCWLIRTKKYNLQY